MVRSHTVLVWSGSKPKTKFGGWVVSGERPNLVYSPGPGETLDPLDLSLTISIKFQTFNMNDPVLCMYEQCTIYLLKLKHFGY